MGFLDRAKNLLSQHDDKVDQGLDKVGDAAKERFAGHDEQIDGLIDQAQERTGEGDTTQEAPPAPEGEAPPAAPEQDQAPPPQQ